MPAKSKKDQDQSTIYIGNTLVIGTVKKIYENMVQSFKTDKQITLQSDLVETIDLTGIQLLVWARGYANKSGIELSASIKFSEGAGELITKAGFASILN